MNRLEFFSLLALLILGGCSSTHNRHPLENTQFLVITASYQDSYASLAEEYLGSSSKAELIKRLNPDMQIKHGSRIAIPLTNTNRSAVFEDGYQSVPILCYHQFTKDSKGRTKMVVPLSEFKWQMEYLYKNNYNVIDLKELKSFIDGDIALPRKTVVITVDDGYKSFYDVAFPVLQKYGFKATVFVYLDFVSGRLALSWKEVKKLENNSLISIESHSKTHRNLSVKQKGESLAQYNAKLRDEVLNTEKIFKNKLSHQTRFFAYPFGDASEQLIDLLEERDYHLAFTVERGNNSTFSSRYQLNRNMVYGGQSFEQFKQSLIAFSKVDFR